MILSASRRTDIPAFYSEWFVNRLKEGYFLVRNPMNPTQISRIPVSPITVDCIVFWTKDPENMLDKLDIIDNLGYRYYYQFTLTPYGRELERNLREKAKMLQTFETLSDRIGRERVLWRYDPIVLNDRIDVKYHQEEFTKLCRRLSEYTGQCTISFVDLYAKLSSQVMSGMIREITTAEISEISSSFSQIAKEYGITLKSCCEQIELKEFRIEQASCIDKAIVEKVCGYEIDAIRSKNQRPGCNCLTSVDIGAYHTCKNGCAYCYANSSVQRAQNNWERHNPSSPLLNGEVNEGDTIFERKLESLKKD